jgi:hypothetical protein
MREWKEAKWINLKVSIFMSDEAVPIAKHATLFRDNILNSFFPV